MREKFTERRETEVKKKKRKEKHPRKNRRIGQKRRRLPPIQGPQDGDKTKRRVRRVKVTLRNS